MDGRARSALRRGIGCPDANRVGLTLEEREACERRDARVAEENAPNLGRNPVSQDFPGAVADRDGRRARHAQTPPLGTRPRPFGGDTRDQGSICPPEGCRALELNPAPLP